MRSLLALIAAIALCCVGLTAAQPVGQFPFALTREGQMLGAVEGEVASFKGLAYAAAPVGPLRWRAPEPTAESSEMRTAYDYGAPCLQPSLPGTSEDCLTLNVFRPFGVDGPLPVMVFIHGGGFVTGTANDPLFDGARLAQAGLIVVTVNYRLGALGWLVQPDGGSGNYGLMDQIAALRWVRDNIAAFGGDPRNVTLFGSDAGATSIALLMLCQEARGLFQKAILQSVPGRTRLRTPQEAAAAGRQFAAALAQTGKDSDPRAVEPARLLAAEKELLAKSAGVFAPVTDGVLVTEAIAAGFAAGHESRIPLLIGANDDETGFDSARDVKEALASLGDGLEALRKLYPEVSTNAELAARVYTDKVFSEPVRLLARLHAAQSIPVFRYRFGYVPEAWRGNAEEGRDRELQFIFGAEGVPGAGIFTRRDREVASRLRGYWINFARTGDPNGPDLPHWDAASDRDRLLLITNDRIASGDDPLAERLDRLAR